MNSNILTGRIFKYIRKLKMANTRISETETDIEELQISHAESQYVLHLRTSYIILKVSKKTRKEKQELFGLRK